MNADEEAREERAGQRASSERRRLDVEVRSPAWAAFPRPTTMLSVMRFGSARIAARTTANTTHLQVDRHRRISTRTAIGRSVKTNP